ncbi:MAG TPA: citrate synthase [Lachnospiraceae bacterium]|nr:citrate synthase [Lachnospiraceae bacterium]
MEKEFGRITPKLQELAEQAKKSSYIDPELYTKYNVKRGLRDLNGRGVLVGITDISEVCSTKEVDGKLIPIDGQLYYRGYNVRDIIMKSRDSDHFGFEECCYLLLFGHLPDIRDLAEFQNILGDYRSLPKNFVRDVIMKKPSKDIMNSLSRSVLTLYSYDDNADDTSPANVLRQCAQLISMFPLLSVYGYQAYRHYHQDGSLIIHQPRPELSTAENILHCLRDDSKYTQLEAKLLDVALILHMEHGGGNNSTFTTHLVSSSGTDTYSAIAAALGSLKGPKHGGANIKVVKMFEDMKKTVKDWTSEEEVSAYLEALLDKKAFDNAGLIYGMGHAIYSISDPRAVTFKGFVKALSEEKGYQKEFALYSLVEKLAPKIISKKRKMYKGVSPNVDFYSGFAYQMLDLPIELYTPLFAIARIAGWSAHRMEEICHNGKIMRPAYMTVCEHKEFVPIEDR